MWAWACGTAVYVINLKENTNYWEISNGNVEWSRDEELASSMCV
jgi:hypothetical protein